MSFALYASIEVNTIVSILHFPSAGSRLLSHHIAAWCASLPGRQRMVRPRR